jgi:hypothetical protein
MNTIQSELENIIKSTLGAEIVLIEVSHHEYIAAFRKKEVGAKL